MKSILSSKVPVDLFPTLVVKGLLICLGVFCGVDLMGQSTVIIDFETANNGYSSSALEGATTSYVDIFNRSNADLPSTSNEDGFYWAIEDASSGSNTLTIDQIDITGASDFVFSLDMLAHHFEDWDDADELLITYSLDGGGFQNLLWVQMVPSDAFNGPAAIDVGFDGDGDCGLGTTLPAISTGTQHSCSVSSSNFENFGSNLIALSGNTTLDIVLQFNGLTSADEGLYIDNIQIDIDGGNPGCSSAPTGQHSDFQSSNITSTTFDISWTQLADTNALVVLRANSAPSSNPTDGTTYSGDAAFGSGDPLGGGFCVFSGSGDSQTITDLTPGTEYFLEIFSYCGSPEFYNTSSPLTASVLTEPENPDLSIDCATSSYFDLSWANPSTGDWDGFVVIARENASPTTINSVDPSTLTFNTNFGAAPIQGVNRIVYRGTGNAATITGITASNDYTFKIFAYKNCTACDNPSLWEYSSGTQSTETALLSEVENLASNPAETSIDLTWNANTACRDEIIVVASESPIVGTPVGSNYAVNSSSFTDGLNPMLGAGEIVVYSGTGTSVNVTDLTTDTEYCFTVFVRKGTEWSQGASICETPRLSTSLEPGDLSIISVVTNIGSGADEFCFISFKTITENTSIEFTDNGYERVSAGLWGDTEGVYQLTRINGAAPVPAGSPICIEGQGSNNSGGFQVYVCGVLDNDWTVTSVNGSFSFNLNSQDQIWIMQDGSWSNPSGSHNGTYDGNILYGWTAVGWEPNINYASTSGSTLYPNSSCLNTDLQTLNNDIVKYNGPFTAASKVEWITRINDADNWDAYADYSTFSNSFPKYADSCVTFDLTAGVFTDGLWQGDVSTDWFDCRNWASLRLPEDNVDVEIPDVANDPIINATGAESNNITINSDAQLIINAPDALLEINGNLIIEGTLNHTDGIIDFVGTGDQTISDNNPGVGTIALSGLTLNNSTGNLLTDEIITISDNFTATQGLFVLGDNSYVHFLASATTSGASNNSYIDGPVRKTVGTGTNFTFPIGDSNADGNFYQPARVFGQASGTSVIEAQYFLEAHPFAGVYYDGESNTPGDNHEIGNCDFWSVNQISGTGNPQLALTYTNSNPLYCNEVAAPEFMRIASLNAINEWDLTSSGDSGNEIVMSTTIGAPVTGGSYGDFSFYSDGGDDFNVLPIELTFYDAKALTSTVLSTWQTSSETNNDYFTIERSSDAVNFEAIGTVEGAGNSHVLLNYAFEDFTPLPGLSYYRLKQTDFDGAFAYSEVRSVAFEIESKFDLFKAYRSANELVLSYHSEYPFLTVEIFDVTGQRVYNRTITTDGNFAKVYLLLQRGAYVVRISNGQDARSRKFIW